MHFALEMVPKELLIRLHIAMQVILQQLRLMGKGRILWVLFHRVIAQQILMHSILEFRNGKRDAFCGLIELP